MKKIKSSLFFMLFFVAFLVNAQKINKNLELKVFVVKEQIKVPKPSDLDPLGLNAQLVWSEDKTQCAIVMKVELMLNWHIYASITSGSPFIPSKIEFNLPKGLTPLSDWEKPDSEAYNDDCTIYLGEELYFVRYFSVNKGVGIGNLKIGLYYQACDPYKCFPPNTKTINLIK